MAETMSSYRPVGMPARVNVPSSWVTVPLEVLLRKTLTPARGLPVAESLTDPVSVLTGDWADSRETVRRAKRRNERVFFMEYRGLFGVKIREIGRGKC